MKCLVVSNTFLALFVAFSALNLVKCAEFGRFGDDLESEIEDGDSRTLFTSNGAIYLNLNSTVIATLGISLLLGGVLIYALIKYAPELGLLPGGRVDDQEYQGYYQKYESYQNYYDPDLAAADSPIALAALASAKAAEARLRQQQQQQQLQQQLQQRRRRSNMDYNLATAMSQLETAFKKYEVHEIECRMFVACEAAQKDRLGQSGPLAQAIAEIFDTDKVLKLDERMMGVKKAYDYGLEMFNLERTIPNRDSCKALRERCYQNHKKN